MFEKIKNLIADELDIDSDKITPESSLSDDLSVDSLDAIELIMAIEEKFNLSIPDENAQNFKTVGDIISFIEKAQKKN